MLLYRALNEEDMKNLSLEEDILCQAREHDLNHASIIDIIFRKNNILPSFYIIKHIRNNAKDSMWISTSKDFNFVAREYAIVQAGNYNSYKKRKNIAILDIPEEEFYDLKQEKKGKVRHSSYLDLAKQGALQELVDKKDVLPFYVAKEEKGLHMTREEEIKKAVLEYVIPKISASDWASKAREVLIFSEIKKEYVKGVLTPLMQDYLYVKTKKIEQTIRVKGVITHEPFEITQQKIEEKVNQCVEEFLSQDLQNWQTDIFNNKTFSPFEKNLIQYMYQENNTLVFLVSDFYNGQKSEIRYDIEGFYEVLKETKRDILRKLTGEKNIALLDDEIFVLNQNKKIPKERKNDVIYFVNNEKKLVFNMKPSLK
uniref:hypothetical protein n=1 Tax=Candidatus Ventrenecus sp. TaxID=3085654 RepID=UPI004026C82C